MNNEQSANSLKLSRKEKQTNRDIVKNKFAKLIKKGCCSKSKNRGGCLKEIGFNEVLRLRMSFWSKSEEEQNQFIIDELEEQRLISNITFRVNHAVVCCEAWCFAFGINPARYYKRKNEYLTENRRNGETLRKGTREPSIKMIQALNWLKTFANDAGDHPPDGAFDARVLPACYTKLAVYEIYKEEIEDVVTLDYFRKLWKDHCPKVTISQNNKFAKCGVCTLIKETKRNTRDAKLRKELSIIRDLHNQQQMGERSKYYKHRDKAKNRPNTYASLIIDGMDQNKTGLPHFIHRSKGAEAHFLKNHITGVLSHGTNESWQFIDLHEWKHDSNFTITVLLNGLMKIARENKLPPVVYLQFDNCWRENKNQFILAFCSLLVKMKIVRKIRLSYLLVGHTHEDIDSTFGHISTKLAKNDAPTLSALEQLIKQSYKPSPKVERMKVVYDFKSWLQENIRQLSNHTEPHAYKFELNGDGEVATYFKRFSMDKEWESLRPILSHIPKGYPGLVRPHWEKQTPLEDIKVKIRTCHMLLSSSQIEEWNNFETKLEKDQKKWRDEINEKQLYEITQKSFVLSKFNVYSESYSYKEASETDLRRLEGINNMIEKEQRQPRTKAAARSKREKRGEK